MSSRLRQNKLNLENDLGENTVASILVTGSNHGLGLEWVRQYTELRWKVYATCRRPAEAVELRQIAERHSNVSLDHLDVTDPGDIQAIRWEIHGEPIDILLNNAGVYLEKASLNLVACVTRNGLIHSQSILWVACGLAKH